LLAQRLTDPRLAFEPIPAFLVNRFGARSRRLQEDGHERAGTQGLSARSGGQRTGDFPLRRKPVAPGGRRCQPRGSDGLQRLPAAGSADRLGQDPDGGHDCREFAAPDRDSNARIVWFWFTPFAGLVEQAKGAIKSTFVGLRVRDLQGDRKTRGTKSGDVYVTTWASVAATTQGNAQGAQRRRVRAGAGRLDCELRAEGFRIGVVVDEAHHGFTRAAEAVRFYRETMRPDFTLMITATPDDQDVEKFKKAAGIGHLHRVRVSRKEAVDAGLIKDGIKSIAYLAADDQKELVDFAATALADGWGMHNAIKQGLQAAGIGLVPLMLVQVGNSNAAVEEARTRLAALGVRNRKSPGTRRTTRTTICWRWRSTNRRKC
jgi:hypothetical protein